MFKAETPTENTVVDDDTTCRIIEVRWNHTGHGSEPASEIHHFRRLGPERGTPVEAEAMIAWRSEERFLFLWFEQATEKRNQFRPKQIADRSEAD